MVPRDDMDAIQISKSYVVKDWRGRGIATATMDEVNNIAVNQGYNKLYLTVNIYNNSAISIYEKLGFINIGNLVTDIGGGYIMDDYEMEKMIDNAEKLREELCKRVPFIPKFATSSRAGSRALEIIRKEFNHPAIT